MTGQPQHTHPVPPLPEDIAATTANDDMPDLTGHKGGAGATLRAAREAKGLTIETIAEFLRIKPSHLAALEQNRFQDLPAATYASGFLRTYATYLGIDRQEIMRQYQARMRGRRVAPNLAMPQPLPEGRLPGLATLASAAVAIIAILGLWQWYASSPPAQENVSLSASSVATTTPAPVVKPAVGPPVAATAPAPQQLTMAAPTSATVPAQAPTSLTPATAPAVAAPAPAQPKPVATVYGVADKNSHIQIKAVAESWVEISDSSGQTIFKQLLQPGDSYIVPSQDDLYLTSANAGGLTLVIDGTKTTTLGKTNQVLRDMPLDAE